MAFSSYQIERLIRRLRRWIAGPFPGRRHAPDPVRTTPEGGSGGAVASRSRQGAADDPISGRSAGPGRGGGGLKSLAETRRYEAVVEAERERRAGSFMDPPYPESPEDIGIPRIPKLKRDVSPSGGTASRGDAD